MELLPVAEWDRCQTEMRRGERFTAQHPEGMYVRSDSSHCLAGLAISRLQLCEVLNPLLTHVARVEIRHPYPAVEMDGFMDETGDFLLFAEFAKHNRHLVNMLYAYAWPANKQELWPMQQALLALGKRWPLLLADWRGNQLVRLSDSPEVLRYLESLVW